MVVELVADVKVPPELIVKVKPERSPLPMNPLLFAVVAKVMVPPLLILMAVAFPKPAVALLVPAVMVTFCATLIVPVNA